MDVTFSDDQEVLRKSAREFLTDQSPPSVAREVIELGPAAPGAQELWKKMAELGWMGLAFDESHGGLGLSLVDLTILAEEMGRALVSVPWFSTVCLAGEVIGAAGTEEQKKQWLERIASGEVRATLAVFEPDSPFGVEETEASAKASKGGFELSGKKAFVPDLEGADLLVVAARIDGTPGLLVLGADQIEAVREPNFDETRPLFTFALDGVKVDEDRLLGGRPCGADVIETALDRASAILCAEMCGGSQKALDLSVEYAKVRHQFGRPIGSFQGVSHRCADMLLAVEGARSLTYYAAWCCDEDLDRAPLAVSAAKAFCGDAYRSCTSQAIQIHGGIGFTWEHDLHLWYRRAFWSAAFLGDSVFHRERVASLLDL